MCHVDCSKLASRESITHASISRDVDARTRVGAARQNHGRGPPSHQPIRGRRLGDKKTQAKKHLKVASSGVFPRPFPSPSLFLFNFPFFPSYCLFASCLILPSLFFFPSPFSPCPPPSSFPPAFTHPPFVSSSLFPFPLLPLAPPIPSVTQLWPDYLLYESNNSICEKTKLPRHCS